MNGHWARYDRTPQNPLQPWSLGATPQDERVPNIAGPPNGCKDAWNQGLTQDMFMSADINRDGNWWVIGWESTRMKTGYPAGPVTGWRIRAWDPPLDQSSGEIAGADDGTSTTAAGFELEAPQTGRVTAVHEQDEAGDPSERGHGRSKRDARSIRAKRGSNPGVRVRGTARHDLPSSAQHLSHSISAAGDGKFDDVFEALFGRLVDSLLE
jgi:hypothetical protein